MGRLQRRGALPKGWLTPAAAAATGGGGKRLSWTSEGGPRHDMLRNARCRRRGVFFDGLPSHRGECLLRYFNFIPGTVSLSNHWRVYVTQILGVQRRQWLKGHDRGAVRGGRLLRGELRSQELCTHHAIARPIHASIIEVGSGLCSRGTQRRVIVPKRSVRRDSLCPGRGGFGGQRQCAGASAPCAHTLNDLRVCNLVEKSRGKITRRDPTKAHHL